VRNTLRRVSFAAVVVSAAVLLMKGPLGATESPDLCKAVECSRGPQKCAVIFASAPDERCEEGVMCCPFPEVSWEEHCYEGAT
jgi:hypothetical protein